jgi:hypothetical protein
VSPEFGESQTYPRTFDSGVFSPVIAARQDGVQVDLNLSYTTSTSPDMRRIPNMFAGSSSDATHALFDGMPDAHEVFSELPGAHRMFTDEEGADIMNDMIGGSRTGAGAANDDVGEDEIEETIEVIDTDTNKSLGKRKPRGPAVGIHHSKWKSLEDECLIDSWKAMSLILSPTPTKPSTSTTQGFEMNSTSAATLETMPRFP